MIILCPVCEKEFEVKPNKRDDVVTCCPRCRLHIEVSRKKDEFGRIWKVTFTEKPKDSGGWGEMSGPLLIIAWIIIILLLFYLYYFYYPVRS
jgi:hypothetical protein